MVKAGEMIHIGESLVKGKKEEKKEGVEGEEKKEEQKEESKEGEEAKPATLAVAVDSKGIIGTDGRKCIPTIPIIEYNIL